VGFFLWTADTIAPNNIKTQQRPQGHPAKSKFLAINQYQAIPILAGAALSACLALGSSAQAAVVMTGSLTATGSSTFDLTASSNADWAVFLSSSKTATDQKKDATVLGDTVTVTGSGRPLQNPAAGTSPYAFTFEWTADDAQSGVGNTTNERVLKQEYTNTDTTTPTLSLSGTATGIGSGGVFTLYGGTSNNADYFVTVDIGTVGNQTAYGSFTTNSLTSGESNIGSIDYSGVTDTNAVLSWTYTSADNGTVNRNKHRLGAIAINVVPIPEPSTTALLGLGGLALILRRHK
jgi:hypothetical protein